jgi:hypothetical protein
MVAGDFEPSVSFDETGMERIDAIEQKEILMA